MSSVSIGDVLFTKTQRKVLGLLFGKPDQRFYANEIVRWVDMGRGTVNRELQRFTEAGLLTRTDEGKQHYYQANRQAPIYLELLGLVRKTFGVADVIKSALKDIDASIELAFVYGSVAKTQETSSSDVDLMLVGTGLSYGEIMEFLAPVEQELGRPVNPTIYTPEQFAAKLKEGSSFIVRVMEQPKLMIKGTIDDSRESVQDR